ALDTLYVARNRGWWCGVRPPLLVIAQLGKSVASTRADRHRSFLISFSRIPRPMGANKIKELWQFFLSQTKSVWVFILGNLRPSAFAVLRFIVSSNFVG